jgi:hypothetical protein
MKTKLLKKLRSRIFSISYGSRYDRIEFYPHDGSGRGCIELDNGIGRVADLRRFLYLCLGGYMSFIVALAHQRTLSKRAEKRAEREKKKLGKITYNLWRYGR